MSRKERRANAHEKHGGTGKARPEKVESPCPIPEALTGYQLRRVEVDRQDEETPASIGVRSNSQKLELASGPL